MVFSEFDLRRYEAEARRFVEGRRPPPHLRNKVDLAYRIKGQSLELFEIRAIWDDPEKTIEEGVAKATYIKSRGVWRVFWQRADLRWHRYDPSPEVDSLEEVLQIVGSDEYACFFG